MLPSIPVQFFFRYSSLRSRVLDIERAVNGGMATGVLLCVRETDPKQVDVRYDDGTCRRLLPESRFKLLVEPSVREGP